MLNANRRRGDDAYYCIPSSTTNFLCHQVDNQISTYLHGIPVGEAYLPAIRELYAAQLESLVSKAQMNERTALKKSLQDLADEELRCARLHAKRQISDETWETIWNEWQEQRKCHPCAVGNDDENL